MRALVTGGAGFIGSHLAERLLADGCSVVVLDNLSTGRMENIAGLRGQPGFDFVEADVRNRSLVGRLVGDCDVVFHLAAAVGVRLIADNPVRTIETNIDGTQAVLEAAGGAAKRVLIASTSEVYGKNEVTPFSEDDDIVLGSTSVARWSYAASKAIDEFLAIAFHRQFGLDVVIARFFNTIGPRQTGQYGMVVPRFIESALKNEPLEVYGTGGQSRCFCYVGDVVDAVVALSDCKQAFGTTFNVGSTEEITIDVLADKIIGMTESKSEKRYIPYEVAYGGPMEDMMRRVPSLERIKRAIGWQPKRSLTESLRIIINSVRE